MQRGVPILIATMAAIVAVSAKPAKQEQKFVGLSQLEEDEKLFILGMHNDLRRSVANGSFTSYNKLPPAANMKQLIWKDELAEEAGKKIASCRHFYHDETCGTVDGFSFLGETSSLITLTLSQSFPMSSLNDSRFVEYYSRLSMEGLVRPSQLFSYPNKCRNKDQCNHFTQMIWGETGFVGCALGVCEKPHPRGMAATIAFICKYGPSGNWRVESGVLKPPYKAGRTCSKCPVDAPECIDGLCQARPQVPCEDKIESECALAMHLHEEFCERCSPFNRQALYSCRKSCNICHTFQQRYKNILNQNFTNS